MDNSSIIIVGNNKHFMKSEINSPNVFGLMAPKQTVFPSYPAVQRINYCKWCAHILPQLDILLLPFREGWYGWFGLGGSLMQWHPDLKIGFGFCPSFMNAEDVLNQRGATLQNIVKQCIMGQAQETKIWIDLKVETFLVY